MGEPYRIALLPGDGIGPEVASVGRAVLQVLGATRDVNLRIETLDLGAERYLRDGTTLPEDTFVHLRDEVDAILVGALGDPRVPDSRHARDILLGLRTRLDLYANIRPAECLVDRLMPLQGRGAADCRMCIYRENTEGEYVDRGTVTAGGTPDEVAVDHAVHTRRSIERIVRAAFAHARTEVPPRLHLADKHNAIPRGHGLWHRVFTEVAAEHSDVTAHHAYADALCLQMLRDPGSLRVVVTTNLLGDLLSDLAAGLAGGLGLMPSANVHPGRPGGLFEPVHGSAPELAGQDRANPLAMVRTVGMMLAQLGRADLRQELERVCRQALETRHCTPDVGGTLGTRATGEWVVHQLRHR